MNVECIIYTCKKHIFLEPNMLKVQFYIIIDTSYAL